MDFFKKLGEQFKKFWEETSNSARIGMIATMGISFALIVGVGYWSSQPSYVALPEEILSEDYDEVVKALEKKGISYQTSPSGSVVSVDRSKLALARAAISGIVGTETGPSIGVSMTDGPEARREQALNRRQAAVAKKIALIKGIKSAIVDITPAKLSMMKNTNNEARVSVLLDFKANYHATQEVINAVAECVRHERGLKRENISITDTNGRVYELENSTTAHSNIQRSFQLEVETSTRQKIEEHLRRLVGIGNFTVSVTADTEYTESETQSHKVHPEAVLISQKKIDRENSDGRSGAGVTGVAGTQTNFPNPSPNVFEKLKETTEDTKNHYSFSNKYEKKALGLIKRLAVSVLVQPPVDADGNPISTVDQAAVEECVKTAAGINETRGDMISVQIGSLVKDPFFDELFAAPVDAPSVNNEFILEVVRNSSLGLGSIFAFVIGFLILRKMKPVTITTSEPQISPERSKHLSDLSRIAKENPEFLSRIVAGWINETPADEIGGASDFSDNSAANNERAAA